jgi:hypothetical protein
MKKLILSVAVLAIMTVAACSLMTMAENLKKAVLPAALLLKMEAILKKFVM